MTRRLFDCELNEELLRKIISMIGKRIIFNESLLVNSYDTLKHSRRSWHQISEYELKSNAIMFGQDEQRFTHASQFGLEWLSVYIQNTKEANRFK